MWLFMCVCVCVWGGGGGMCGGVVGGGGKLKKVTHAILTAYGIHLSVYNCI